MSKTLAECNISELRAIAADQGGFDYGRMSETRARAGLAKFFGISVDAPVPDWDDSYSEASKAEARKSAGMIDPSRDVTHLSDGITTSITKDPKTRGGVRLVPGEKMFKMRVSRPHFMHKSRRNFLNPEINGQKWIVKFDEEVPVPGRVVEALLRAEEVYDVSRVVGTDHITEHVSNRRYPMTIQEMTPTEVEAYFAN